MVLGQGQAGPDLHGAEGGASEAARSAILGLTLRQIVVLALAVYAAMSAVFMVKKLSAPKSTIVGRSEKILINFHGGSAVEVGTEDMFESRSSRGDTVNSSDSRLESVSDPTEGSDDEFFYDLQTNLFHSSVVFALNYDEMMSKFRIFVYPRGDHSFTDSSDDTSLFRHTDTLFFQQLYLSKFITSDPEMAHLYLLPLSMRALVDDESVGPQKIGKYLNKYVQNLRDAYPFWWRTLGADHVVITCHEAKEDGSRNVLELKKNAIQVACSPLNGSQTFYPHKDVAMPLYQSSPRPVGDLEDERATLVYYHGPIDALSSYASFGVDWEFDSSFAFESSDAEPAVHYRRLLSSKFCLILGPQDYPNIASALRFGCVPVIISDGKLYDLPFQDILDWHKFTVVISREIIKDLKSLLLAFDEQLYVAKQFLGKEASRHLEWHARPQGKDAFHMVLYDLWIRRHAVRYVRRDDL